MAVPGRANLTATKTHSRSKPHAVYNALRASGQRCAHSVHRTEQKRPPWPKGEIIEFNAHAAGVGARPAIDAHPPPPGAPDIMPQ